MRVAVTYENGNVFGHFGHTEQFKIYEVENGEILSSEVVDTLGSGHGALAQFLSIHAVDALICGGIGMGARMALEEVGILLMPGVSGSADEAAESFACGNLEFNPDAKCNHHHDGEHDCGSHTCGGHCGGNH